MLDQASRSCTHVHHALNCSRRMGQMSWLPKAEHAALELETYKLDLFVGPGPAVVWLVSRNEADLAGFWHLLVREETAWGVRRGNGELLAAVNGVLAQWKKDGTLRKVLLHWIPYLDRIQANET